MSADRTASSAFYPMKHPIGAAALAAGFLDVGAATTHPFDLWRERLSALPFGKIFSMEHRPEAICGWPVGKATLWAAISATPPFTPWPDGYGEAAGYYVGLSATDAKTAVWETSVRKMGYEALSVFRLPDRAIAIRAGLGVHGLFGPLITPRHGSFVAIATLLVRTGPPEGARGPEHDCSPGCERCGRCIAACPTGAISMNGGIDAMKCLRKDMSYPDAVPKAHYSLMGRRIMGCDICQRACPHNRKITPLKPSANLIAPFKLENLLAAPDIDALAARIGTFYAKKTRIVTQAVLAAANTGRADLLPRLRALADGPGSNDKDSLALRRALAWALEILEAR